MTEVIIKCSEVDFNITAIRFMLFVLTLHEIHQWGMTVLFDRAFL